MKKALNDQSHLEALQSYYAEHRVLPSYARLMSVFSLASKSAVKKVLERLESAGSRLLDRLLGVRVLRDAWWRGGIDWGVASAL